MVVNDCAGEICGTRLIKTYKGAKENNNKKLEGYVYLGLVVELAATSVGI